MASELYFKVSRMYWQSDVCEILGERHGGAGPLLHLYLISFIVNHGLADNGGKGMTTLTRLRKASFAESNDAVKGILDTLSAIKGEGFSWKLTNPDIGQLEFSYPRVLDWHPEIIASIVNGRKGGRPPGKPGENPNKTQPEPRPNPAPSRAEHKRAEEKTDQPHKEKLTTAVDHSKGATAVKKRLEDTWAQVHGQAAEILKTAYSLHPKGPWGPPEGDIALIEYWIDVYGVEIVEAVTRKANLERAKGSLGVYLWGQKNFPYRKEDSEEARRPKHYTAREPQAGSGGATAPTKGPS